MKNKLQDNLARIEKEERDKRHDHEELVQKRMEEIQNVTKTNE